MKKLMGILKKRWVWGIGAFLLFAIGFAAFFGYRNHQMIKAADATYQFKDGGGVTVEAGGTFTMRQLSDTYTLTGLPSGNLNCKWSSARTDILEIDGNSEGTALTAVTLKAKTTGSSLLTVTITDANGVVVASPSVTVTVVFSISEYLDGSAQGAVMTRVYDKDERKALVLDYGAVLEFGANADTDTNKLNLIFGSANSELATWKIANTDIIKTGVNAQGKKCIMAVGAGRTELSVDYTHGTDNWRDTIKVYVRPQVTVDAASGSAITVGGVQGGGLSGNTGATAEVENGDTIGISVLKQDSSVDIDSKIIWVISKSVNGQSKLVRDSLGNTDGYGDDANLVYIDASHEYRVDAKAGTYFVEFYVIGTYTNFADSQKDDTKSGIPSVGLDVQVDCTFESNTIALSLGSSYSLSDAFNIPQEDFEKYFLMSPDDEATARTLLTWASSGKDFGKVSTNSNGILGRTTFTVELKSIHNLSVIPGLKNREVKVTFVVTDTFELNISATKLAVGSTLDLYGIIGSNPTSEPSQFVWTISSDVYASLSNTNGQYATVTAKAETPKNKPVRVSLAWTDKDNTTWVAYCDITVTSSATAFQITPATKSIEAGATDYLQTNLSGTQNILWVSSDTSIVTVEAQTGNVGAKITATQKVGTVVITAINKDNDTYATCVVTVLSAITSITIDKGTSYTVSAATPYVFLNAVYQPANATSSDLVWDSSDKSIATVDENGMVTVLKIGQTTISVTPVYNPNGVYAQCVLTVKEDPITGIRTNVTSLTMIRGDKYEVITTLTPTNPTDKTLTWSSTKPSVASVSNGTITAVGVGTTTIMVKGGTATALIEVTVIEKITSIQFAETEVTIEEGEQKTLEVIYTPAANITKDVTFRSTDTSVVTIDANGVITGVSEGMAMIIATSEQLGAAGAITCMVYVTTPTVIVEEFEIDPTELTLRVGEEDYITPIYTPEDTTSQEVSYTSKNEEIATVTEEGVVTGVAPGYTIIYCEDVESGKTAICEVTVEEGIKFSLSPSTREIAIGKSFQIKKVTVPTDADKTAVWESSNSAIASVSSSGKVTGKKLGSCTITCTLVNWNQSATCRVKVAKLKSTIKLDKTSIRMNVGSTYRLKKTVTSNNTNLPSVKFTSKNKKIASVGQTSGKITAKKVGATIITAKTTDAVHATAKCRVIVIRRATSVSLNKTYGVCYVGRTLKLTATVKPSNASIKKLKWTSSSSKIASVTSGKVTGYAEGEVTITATTTDGGNKKARCFVKVVEPIPISSVVVAQSDLTMKKGDTAQLSYTTLPSDNSDTIKMASDNKRVATVTNSGKVTAVGTGNATITITATSGVTATVTVNVVALNKTSVQIRQYDTETVRVLGTSDTITWYSANNRIATVTGGKIVGRGIGTTYIYAYVNGCKMSCKVQVVSVNTKKR